MNEPVTQPDTCDPRLDRIAAEVAEDNKLGSMTFECEDERQDALASAGLEARRRFGLTDEEWSYVRDALSEMIAARKGGAS